MKKTIILQRKSATGIRKAAISDTTRMLIVRMASCGLSNKAIRDACDVTDYQIYQAQKWANVKKVDYRDAINPIGKHVQKKLIELDANTQLKHLQKLLLK